MTDKRQMDLLTDAARGKQLKLLRDVRLDTFTTERGDGVKPDKQKAVLRMIDDHDGNSQGCFASQQTLANEIGCSVSTVGRAVEVLVSRGFITLERDKRTGTNCHRIVWNELNLYHLNYLRRNAMVTEANHHDDDSRNVMVTDAKRHGDSPRNVMVTDSLCHGDGQNETETQLPNATPTATDENGWVMMRKRLRDLGMTAAATATASAQQRGLSLEYVDELVREATERKHANIDPPGVSHLCNWMTGKTFPPIDEADAVRIRSERLVRQREQAEAIRSEVYQSPRLNDQTDKVKAGYVARKLAKIGLEGEATDDERAAAAMLDEFDRQREAKHAEVAS